MPVGTARGPLAAADPQEPEPTAPDDPIRHAPDTILTPHPDCATRQNFRPAYEGAVTSVGLGSGRAPAAAPERRRGMNPRGAEP